MKTTTIIYRVITALLSVFCVYGSFLDIQHNPDAVALINQLGYPVYFITFIGVVRLLGVIAILIPGYPRIKEWAYAGLVFDMGGALYSHIATHNPFSAYAPAALALILALGSYIYYQKWHGPFTNKLQSGERAAILPISNPGKKDFHNM